MFVSIKTFELKRQNALILLPLLKNFRFVDKTELIVDDFIGADVELSHLNYSFCITK